MSCPTSGFKAEIATLASDAIMSKKTTPYRHSEKLAGGRQMRPYRRINACALHCHLKLIEANVAALSLKLPVEIVADGVPEEAHGHSIDNVAHAIPVSTKEPLQITIIEKQLKF
jgi:hypothetical protein